MDMLKGAQIATAGLTDWRKLAQGLRARYVIDDFGTAVRFVAAVGEAGGVLGQHPTTSRCTTARAAARRRSSATTR